MYRKNTAKTLLITAFPKFYLGRSAALSYSGLRDREDQGQRPATLPIHSASSDLRSLIDSQKHPDCNKSLSPWLFSFAICCTLMSVNAPASIVEFNEIHYDNAGADIDEGVELIGLSSVDISGWALSLYNGNNGEPYDNLVLNTTNTSTFVIEDSGLSFHHVDTGSLQNGPADGIALVDRDGVTQSFISYEGSILAISGPASGLVSLDIGITENGETAPGFSLQRTGTIGMAMIGAGISTVDQWVSAPATWGSINTGQMFTDGVVTEVPLPASGLLMLCGLAACSAINGVRQRQRSITGIASSTR